jgi:uncharacterized protein YkwD
MKNLSLLFICLLTVSISLYSQKWTKAQLEIANTAKDISYLTKVEKDVILYINLCRLFPKEFAQIEVAKFELTVDHSDSILTEFAIYKKSLIIDLERRQNCKALKFDKLLYLDAKCYSNEISKVERNGHDRIDCKLSNYAECISFGQETGKKIALQLLIDVGIESLGHRKICLDKSYNKIGFSSTNHFIWKFCAVGEFI